MVGHQWSELWVDSCCTPWRCDRLRPRRWFVVVNRLFFDVCDGIFLNYWWKESSLEQSKQLSSELSRTCDVYVGVDVFGRGCCGNGGFNTVEVGFLDKSTISVLLRDLYFAVTWRVHMWSECSLFSGRFPWGSWVQLPCEFCLFELFGFFWCFLVVSYQVNLGVSLI